MTKDIIDNYESLSIMHSVLSILNLLMDNLDLDFAELAKIINVTYLNIYFAAYCENGTIINYLR